MKIYPNRNLLLSLRPQEIKGEKIINIFRFILCFAFLIILLIVIRNNQWEFSQGNFIVFLGILIGLIHGVFLVFLLRRDVYHPLIKFINPIIESIVITMVIYSSGYDLYSSRASMFIVNSVYVYFLFSGLSVLRLSFRASFLSGFCNAIGYLLLIFIAKGQGVFEHLYLSNDPNQSMVIRFALDNELIKAFFIFLCGLIAGYGTVRNKKLVLAYLEKQKALDELNHNLEKKVKLRTNEIQKRQDIMESELDLAREIQTKLLLQGLPEHPKLKFYSKYLPAHKVGGDFYDVFVLNANKIGVFVCDVFGHGVSAAFASTILKMLLERKKYILTNPTDLFLFLDEQLKRVVTKNYVTAFYGIIDCEARQMTYANVGLLPPLIFNPKAEKAKFLDFKGGTLGTPLKFEMETKVYDLNSKDRVVIYTDGLIESMNSKTLELYGEERFMDYIVSNRKVSSNNLIQGLFQEIRKHSQKDELDDDMTIMVVEFD